LEKNALEHRWDKSDFGWRQDDIFMAYLGLTDQAQNYIVARSGNYDKELHFPLPFGAPITIGLLIRIMVGF